MATTNNHDELLAFATRVLDRLSLKISNHSLATGEMMTLIKRYGQTQVMEAIVAMLDMTQASIGNFGAYLTSALKGGWDLAEKAKAQKLPLQVPHGLVKTQSLLESQNLSFGKLIEKDDKTLTSWQEMDSLMRGVLMAWLASSRLRLISDFIPPSMYGEAVNSLAKDSPTNHGLYLIRLFYMEQRGELEGFLELSRSQLPLEMREEGYEIAPYPVRPSVKADLPTGIQDLIGNLEKSFGAIKIVSEE